LLTLESTSRPWWQRLLTFGQAEVRRDTEVAFLPGFLESLERLRILAVKTAGGGLNAGHRLGAYKGGQLEFSDYRPYSPGDDLRYLDWNLYARLGRPYIKEFAREEAGHIHILLDATPSMALGTPSKWTFARRVAALFAHIGWSAKDKVRVHVFRDQRLPLESYPKHRTSGGTPQLMEWLARQPTAPPAWEAQNDTADAEQSGLKYPSAPSVSAAGALTGATQAFLRGAPARGRVFIVSDFWHEEAEISNAVQRLGAAGFELTALHVLAADEAHAPDLGAWRVLSPEESGEVDLSVSATSAARYQSELDAHLTAVECLFRRRGGLYLYERSDTPLERVLLQTLRKRRWLR